MYFRVTSDDDLIENDILRLYALFRLIVHIIPLLKLLLLFFYFRVSFQFELLYFQNTRLTAPEQYRW